jgi:hypothetical protein
MQSTTIAPTLLLALALSAAFSSRARADEPSAPATHAPASAPASPLDQAAGPPVVRRWYGWEPLAADAGSVALGLAGLAAHGSTGQTLMLAGAGGFVIGAPAIHSAHGHSGKAALSLLLHTTCPLLGLFFGSLAGAFSGSGHALDSTVTAGFTVGAVTASAIDAFVLAREDVTPAPPPPPDLRARIEPRVAPTRGGALVGIGGTF